MMGHRVRWGWGLLLFWIILSSIVTLTRSELESLDFNFEFETEHGDDESLLRAGGEEDSWPELYSEHLEDEHLEDEHLEDEEPPPLPPPDLTLHPEPGHLSNGEGGTADDAMSPLELVVKEEIQLFNRELINFYREQSLREKRSYARFTYDIKLDPSNNYLETKVSSAFAYPFLCHGKGYVIQTDGIYRLDDFRPTEQQGVIYEESRAYPKLTKVNDEWSMGAGDRVLHVKEWEQKCFVLVLHQNGSYSSIYTLHGENLSPILRQYIRNYDGIGTSGKFFTIKKNLFLVTTNDNAVHSLTHCPVFRWAVTYMDEIHSIQTRGATDVETFTINSKEYIAIAQSQDSSGNFEVGTQVLVMDEKETLEKVQLLWSNNPVSLQYYQVLEEHYLLIGHAKEPSVSYVFGGLDFIPVQTLPNYFGPNLFMDNLLLPQDKGPLLLAATSSKIHFYTWSSTSGSLVLNSNNSADGAKYSTQKIVSAKFIRPAFNQIYLAVVTTDNSGYRATLKVFGVNLEKKEIADSFIKETESHLAKCLGDVRKKLDLDEVNLPRLEEETKAILTVDGHHTFVGQILVESSVKVNESVTSIQSIDVIPEQFENRTEPLTTPSVLLESILEESLQLKIDILDQLPNILMSNKPGVISGDYTFLNELQVKEIKAPNTNLELEVLNGIPLADMMEYALKKNSPEPQIITGEWTINKFTTPGVLVPSNFSGVEVDDFLLKKCPNRDVTAEAQAISGRVVFKQDVKIPDGIIMPGEAIVNGITISDLVMKNSPVREILGYKHAQNLIGEDGFTFEFINGKNFPDWYESVLHTDGPPQFSTGVKTLAGPKAHKIINLDPEFVNGHNWEDFIKNVLRNVGDQEIEGPLHFDKLDVEYLEAESIGGVEFSSLLSVNGTEHIHSNITASSLTVGKNFNLQTGLINGVPLMESAVKKNEDAVITGPVELNNFKVSGNVTLEEGGTIGGKDISELAKQRRTQIYFSPRNQTISFKSFLEVDNLETKTLNGYTLEALQNDFWSVSRDNIIQGPLNLKGKKVSVLSDYRTGTLNGLRLEEDLVRVNDAGELSLPTKLHFLGDVIVLGDIILPDGGTLNGKDFSELAQNIVRTGDGRVISGVKTFTKRINAGAGAEIGSLNGINIPEDLVFLNSPDNQFIQGLKTFKHKVTIDTLLTSVDIKVGGGVNGVDLYELGETTAYKDNGPIRIRGNVIFNASFSASDLHIRHKVNDINVTDLLRNVIYLEEEQVIKFPVKIKNSDVNVEGPSNIRSINGIVLDEYLPRVVLSRDYAPDYVINGSKTFLNIIVDGDLICQSLNGISLRDLKAHAFSLTNPQNVTGKFTFETLTIDDNIEVDTIGGIKAKDLVFVNDPEACSVNSDITFLGDVIVNGPLQIDGLINGHSAEYILEGHEGGYYDREFTEIEVLGDLTWDHDRHDADGISHFLQNAVTLDTDQEITGTVIFSQGFNANELDSYPWIDDVDLEKIQQDALRVGDENWDLEGNNTFLKGLVITDPTVTVTRLNARKIQGIDMKSALGKLVWKDSHGVVYGVKHFPNGLDLEDLRFKDLNRKGNFSWLVTKSDNRTIDHMEFINLEITGDLNYNKTKGFDLDSLLTNRITRDGNEVLRGNYTVPSLTVQNGCNVEYINGIKVSDIFFNNATRKQVLGGKKTLKNGLTIDGNLFTPDLNGYNFATLGGEVYRKSLPQRVTIPFTFTAPVIIEDSLEIGQDINGHRIEDLKKKITHTIQGIESRALEPSVSKPSAEKLSQIAELKGNLPAASYWLEYLYLKQGWDVLGPQTRVEFSETENGGIISLHNSAEFDIVGEGWRKGCQCNSVKMVEISGHNIVADTLNVFICKNAFVASADSLAMYSVTDESISYNKTCTDPQEDARLLVIQDGNVLLNVSSIGYLSDVKAFTSKGKDYLVLAYFFLAAGNTHDSFTLVYRVDSKKLTLVQKIPSSGPVRLAIHPLGKVYALAIANSRDPKTDSCLTNSAIYFWSPNSEKFNLVREVKTNGAADVIFMSIEDHGPHYKKGHYLNFVAFAQNGNSGDGEVIILQYDPVKENFLTIQTLRTIWSVTGIEYVCVIENCYLLTVVPQEGVHFYEYRYVEGFQRSLTIPLLGAYDITVLASGERNERLLFPIAAKSPLLAEAAIAGFPISDFIATTNNSGYYKDPFDNIPINLELQIVD